MMAIPPRRVPAAIALVCLAALSGLTTPAHAQGHSDVSVGFYLQEAEGRPPVCSQLKPLACDDSEVVLAGDLYIEYYAYLCIFNGDAQLGIAGVQCAIEFDDASRSGVDIHDWRNCATSGLEFPQDGWTTVAGDGNRILWNQQVDCQREEPGGYGDGVTAIAGYFWLTAYSPDRLQILPWRGEGLPELKIVDCGDFGATGGGEHLLSNENAGFVAFSDGAEESGDLPCVKRIREETTWGTMKNLYNDR